MGDFMDLMSLFMSGIAEGSVGSKSKDSSDEFHIVIIWLFNLVKIV
jgi:hypothetical protein